ncbi:MAG: bacteriohemerythrin [Thermodesulfobacteriota bacterium]
MALEWTQDYSIGIKDIDDQHKELFDRINMLQNAMMAGKGEQEIEGTFKFLEEYIVLHFSSEEKLQYGAGYPDYPGHKDLHEAFKKTFVELKRKFDSSGARKTAVAIEINKAVSDWIIKHIFVEDKKVGRFLKEKRSEVTLKAII